MEAVEIFAPEVTSLSLHQRFTNTLSRLGKQPEIANVFEPPPRVFEDDVLSTISTVNSTVTLGRRNRVLMEFLEFKQKIAEKMKQQRLNVRKKLGGMIRGSQKKPRNMRNYYKGGIKNRLAMANNSLNNSRFFGDTSFEQPHWRHPFNTGYRNRNPQWRRNRRFFNQNRSFPGYQRQNTYMNPNMNNSFNNFRLNNGWGNRGRGRMGMRRQPNQRFKKPEITKEQLDKELDDFMSSSPAVLNKQIDLYMQEGQKKSAMDVDTSIL